MNETTSDQSATPTVAPSMQAALRGLTELVSREAGENLAGLTAFGAVLSPDFDPGRMTAATVMVLDRMDLALLRRLAEHGPALGSQQIAAPLVMTPAYIRRSFDSFPLEMLEIHQCHITLAGRDFFESIEIESQYVRLQCEAEFKRILIRMRQGLLMAGSREDVLAELVMDIGQHLLRTLRGLLWLQGKRDPLPREQVVAESEQRVGSPLPGVRSATLPHGEHGWDEFRALYEDVEKLAVVADEH